jgi:iron complex outermembrane receptor protein
MAPPWKSLPIRAVRPIGRTVFFLFLLAAQNSWSAGAAEPDSRIDSLLALDLEQLVNVEVFLATGTPKALKLAPGTATVISAEEIRRIGAATLDEALRTVAGLTVVPSNLNRMNSIYSIRGIHTQTNPQVLLLLDGMPIRESVHGSRPNTFMMSTANIERIEVVKGPGSALHGADAFAGTINVVTRKASDIDGTEAGIRAGSFGYTDTWAQYGGRIRGWDVALSLDYLRHDGDNSRIVESDLQTTMDTVLGTSASYAPGPLETDDRIHDLHLRVAKENWALRLWKWGQDDGGEGAGSGQILDPAGKENIDYYLADLAYSKKDILRDLAMDLRLNFTSNEEDNYLVIFPPGAVLPIGADGNVDFAAPVGMTLFTDGYIGYPGGIRTSETLDLAFVYSGFASHLFRLGGGYEFTTISTRERKNFGPGVLDVQPLPPVQDGSLTEVTDTPYVFIRDEDRKNWHMLLQDEWLLAARWELTAGVRYDEYSDFGSTINPRLALVWEARSDLTAKFLYGRAFRAPSFGELYFINNPLSLGNRGLDPETSDTVELVFNVRPAKSLATALSFFAYTIDGLIEYVQDLGQTSRTARNALDQEGRGFELEANWLMTETLRATGNFSYQHAEDQGTGAAIPFAPAMAAYANLHWTFLPDWSVDGQYFWTAGRERAVGDLRPEIKDNDLVNLTLRRELLFGNGEVAFAVRNLFDEDVREPSTAAIPNDYPMEERSFWLELRWRL